MKPSISKLGAVLAGMILLGACSQPEEPQVPATQAPVEVVEVPPTIVVEKKPEPTKKVVAPAPKKVVQNYTAEELTTRLANWDKKLNTLDTRFTQVTSYDGVEISRSAGELRYDHAKNLLRLDTVGSDGAVEQSALTNKKEIRIFDEQFHPVTTLSWEEWQQGQPNQALFDFGNYTALLKKHSATLESQTESEAVLALTPNEGEEYTLYLTLDKKDFFPKKIAIKADLMYTRAELTQTRKNETLSNLAFGGIFE